MYLDITDKFLLQRHYFQPLFVSVLSFISLLAKMASKLEVFQWVLVVCLATVECFVTTDEFFMEIIVTEMTFKSQVIALFSFSKSRPVTHAHTHQRITMKWRIEYGVGRDFPVLYGFEFEFSSWNVVNLIKFMNITYLLINISFLFKTYFKISSYFKLKVEIFASNWITHKAKVERNLSKLSVATSYLTKEDRLLLI